MKYLMIIPEGAADFPQDDLGGCTPLMAASTPRLDELCRQGRLGTVALTPADYPCTDDVTLLSLLGYDPRLYHLGFAPIEALGRRIVLEPDCSVIRLNLVTSRDGRMIDHTAGNIGSAEAMILFNDLLERLQRELNEDARSLHIVPLSGHRALLVDETDRSYDSTVMQPAPTMLDRSGSKNQPTGEHAALLRQIINISEACFSEHPVNLARLETNAEPATQVWPWGAGSALPATGAITPFADRFRDLRCIMICSQDLTAGLATMLGWDIWRIDSDDDFATLGDAAVDALDDFDLICVHTAAADWISHRGDCQEKVDVLADIDHHLVAPLAEWVDACDHWRLLVMPSHITSVQTRCHDPAPVPFMMVGERITSVLQQPFCEPEAEEADLHIEIGDELMEYFLFGSGIRQGK